jgi:hypothetical protein
MFNKSPSVKITISFTAILQTERCRLSRNSTYHRVFLQYYTNKPAKTWRTNMYSYWPVRKRFAVALNVRSRTCQNMQDSTVKQHSQTNQKVEIWGLVSLFLDPKDGCVVILLNVGRFIPDYTVLRCRTCRISYSSYQKNIGWRITSTLTNKQKKNSVVSVLKAAERPPLVGEVSARFSG